MNNEKEKKRNFILKILEKVFNFILRLKKKKKEEEKEVDLYSSDERKKLQEIIN
tara:strand:+ start:70 stop:231 length:162 start_codon:yes stop_codon:yes gene_type:complete